MDGIASINARMASIQQTLGMLTPRVAPPTSSLPVTSTTSTGGGRTTSDGDFASKLADEVDRTRLGGGLPSISGFKPEQVRNAAAVIEAGRNMGLSLRDQAIGVMTAIGESSLRVIDYGDKAGPDSRGLFQQRDNGAWGTYAQRMDPTESSKSFFRALERLDGRDGMAPTQVAHKVQRNADPNHYTRYWDDAVRIVSRITGANPAAITR